MAYSNSTLKSDIYQRITDRIVAAIEADGGAGKWCMPWHKGAATGIMPRNAITGHEYRGVNVVVLWCIAEEQGYATGQWATFRQWKSAGASVRKGERAAPVVFWKKFDRKPTDDDDDDGNARKSFMMARGYSVFNVAQVDGYEPEEAELPGERPLVERLEHAEAFVTATGAQRMNGVNRAFYRPANDTIYMPPIEAFTGSDTSTPQEAYYGTLLHELTHWSGAEARCNRQFGKRFGDDAYAAEELVAELGAAFMSAGLGIASEPRADHAKYIESWLRVLKGDKRAIFTAASKASAAVGYCEGLQDSAEPIVVAEPVAPSPVVPEPVVVSIEPKPKRRRKSKRGGVTGCTMPAKGEPWTDRHGNPSRGYIKGDCRLFVDGPPTQPFRKKRRADTRITTTGKNREMTGAAIKKCVHPAPVMLTIFEDGYGSAMSTWQALGAELPVDVAVRSARSTYRERMGREAAGVLYCGNVRGVAERPVFRRLPPLKPGARIGELPSYGGWERPAALPNAA